MFLTKLKQWRLDGVKCLLFQTVLDPLGFQSNTKWGQAENWAYVVNCELLYLVHLQKREEVVIVIDLSIHVYLVEMMDAQTDQHSLICILMYVSVYTFDKINTINATTRNIKRYVQKHTCQSFSLFHCYFRLMFSKFLLENDVTETIATAIKRFQGMFDATINFVND